MKLPLSILALAIICSSPSLALAQRTIEYVGPGCGPAWGYPLFDQSALTFHVREPNAAFWTCRPFASPGVLFLAFSLPGSPVTPLPGRYFGGCVLHGTAAAFFVDRLDADGRNPNPKIGQTRPGLDFHVQGVILLNARDAGGRLWCPPHYLSATPAWRVKT